VVVVEILAGLAEPELFDSDEGNRPGGEEDVRTRLRQLGLIFGLGVAAASGLAAPAFAGAPIGPNQSFLGEVNEKHSGAVVYVVCPGPVWAGRTGPPAGNQTVEVTPSPSLTGPGFTGSLGNHVVVRFTDDPTTKMTLSSYDTPAPISTSLRLPCGGTGKAVFKPKPISGTARSDVLAVTYENIAV